MLKWLKDAQQQHGFDGHQLRDWWHDLMERRVSQEGLRDERQRFFSEVLENVKKVSHWFLAFQSSNYCYQTRVQPSDKVRSPGRQNIEAASHAIYKENALEAVEKLMSFLTGLHPLSSPICVTYFDETNALKNKFWILLRVLSHQPRATKMWYVFMGTKSSISYFSPPPQNSESPTFLALCAHLISKNNSAFFAPC